MMLSSPDWKSTIDLVIQNEMKQHLIFLSDVMVLGVRPLLVSPRADSVPLPGSGFPPASQQISA